MTDTWSDNWSQACRELRIYDSIKMPPAFILTTLSSVEAPQSCSTAATAVPMSFCPAPASTDPLSKSAAQSVAFPQEKPQLSQRGSRRRKASGDACVDESSNPLHKEWWARASSIWSWVAVQAYGSALLSPPRHHLEAVRWVMELPPPRSFLHLLTPQPAVPQFLCQMFQSWRAGCLHLLSLWEAFHLSPTTHRPCQ